MNRENSINSKTRLHFFLEQNRKYNYFDDLVKDLNLDVLFNYMVGKRHDDILQIKDIVSKPILDERLLKDRQKIIESCCQNKKYTQQIYDIVKNGYVKLRNEISTLKNLSGQSFEETSAVSSYVCAHNVLANCLHDIAALAISKHNNKDFFKNTFANFYKELFDIVDYETLSLYKDFAENIDAFKRNGETTFGVRIGYGFKITDIDILDCSEKSSKTSLFKSITDPFSKVSKKNTEIFDDGVIMANNVTIRFLEKTRMFLSDWLEELYVLYKQISFLLGCATLRERAHELGCNFCYPNVSDTLKADSLYELSLAFRQNSHPVPNDVTLNDIQYMIITGANQGGKSTFLRSLGISLFMFQAGMYVPAKEFSSPFYYNIFTHFSRREDAKMNTGRFEEELCRMENIINALDKKPAVILLNESFASTTEQTAATLALDIAHALENECVSLWMVTHITKFAMDFYNEHKEKRLILSAARVENDEELYTMIERKPDSTSFGMDLFNKVLNI